MENIMRSRQKNGILRHLADKMRGGWIRLFFRLQPFGALQNEIVELKLYRITYTYPMGGFLTLIQRVQIPKNDVKSIVWEDDKKVQRK